MEVNEKRLKEVRSFLLFHAKVLRNQRTRKPSHGEQEPQFLVSRNLAYELEKLMDFISQNSDIAADQAELLGSLKSIYDDPRLKTAQESLEDSREIFEMIFQAFEPLRNRTKPPKNSK